MPTTNCHLWYIWNEIKKIPFEVTQTSHWIIIPHHVHCLFTSLQPILPKKSWEKSSWIRHLQVCFCSGSVIAWLTSKTVIFHVSTFETLQYSPQDITKCNSMSRVSQPQPFILLSVKHWYQYYLFWPIKTDLEKTRPVSTHWESEHCAICRC